MRILLAVFVVVALLAIPTSAQAHGNHVHTSWKSHCVAANHYGTGCHYRTSSNVLISYHHHHDMFNPTHARHSASSTRGDLASLPPRNGSGPWAWIIGSFIFAVFLLVALNVRYRVGPRLGR
jgi:hypothetical protein